ncbi:MAG: hypothetical protein IPL27_09515 [Lewinellaceae bacterium]|nr:hypothetical protein [Lewinellaceae bacterium]
MKKVTILLLSVAALISFTQCNNTDPEKLSTNPATRGKLISSLMNNDAYMNEVMDSMQTRHGASMAKNDKAMNAEMMDKMMDMCKSDTAMCKMMMDKTAAMCEADQSKCDMMMGSMGGSPKMMQTMHEMCDMRGMKMEKKK